MKGRKRKNKRRKNSRMPALILAVCMGAGLLSGCTPREKREAVRRMSWKEMQMLPSPFYEPCEG